MLLQYIKRLHGSRPTCTYLIILSTFFVAGIIYIVCMKHDETMRIATNGCNGISNTVPRSQSGANKKLLYGATLYMNKDPSWQEHFEFSRCEFSNCFIQSCMQSDLIIDAEVVLFVHNNEWLRIPVLPWKKRQKQYWVLLSLEPPTDGGQWSDKVNGIFNFTMTYRPDSYVTKPWGTKWMKRDKHHIVNRNNFGAGKNKGAYTYLSDCYNKYYNRLEMINYLKNFIDIDIFGSCTGVKPCSEDDLHCLDKLHSQYHFSLTFESSLCKDYITEMFWETLQSESYVIPVAIGGLTLDDYESVAPPNSYLHVYNFTSLNKLGDHMRYLMDNDAPFNKYHAWRTTYGINTAENQSECQLCKIANTRPKLATPMNLSNWFNEKQSCAAYKYTRM